MASSENKIKMGGDEADMNGYISSLEASNKFRITNDYVTRLCREGKVKGKRIERPSVERGNTERSSANVRAWFVHAPSLATFLSSNKTEQESRKQGLSKIRREEYLANQQYVSSVEAARKFDVTSDYVARLCRAGKVRGRRIGKRWYVDHEALSSFLLDQHYLKAAKRDELARERTDEYSVLAKMLAAKASSFPTGILHAAATATSHLPTKANIIAHVLSPASDIVHKLVGLTVGIALTVGTYAIVNPSVAVVAMDHLRGAGSAMQNAYAALWNGDAELFFARARIQLASVVLSNDNASENSSEGFNSIAGFFTRLARSFNETVDGYIYSLAFPDPLVYGNSVGGNTRGGSVVAKISIRPAPEKTQVPSKTEGVALEKKVPLTVINQPVIERVIETERLVSVGGITEEILTARIKQLDDSLSGRMHVLTSANSTNITNVYQTLGAVARGDNFNDINVTASDWTGGRIENAKISGGSLSGVALPAGDLTGVVAITNGGTGTSTAPSYGQLLLGNSGGTYDLIATSSLGITGSVDGSGNTNLFAYWTDSDTLSATSSPTAGYFVATSSIASILPYASSTAISVSGTGYFGTASTTNLTVSSLSATRIPFIAAAGVFTDSANLTFASDIFTAPSFLATSSSTLQNFTFLNATGTAATTTSFFATTLRSTNFLTTNATTTTLGIGSLTGPLQALSGVVSASSTLSIFYGGTGISTLPTYGQILVGNSSGTYTLTATSSLDLFATGLGASDFGDFTCDGTTCTLDADTVADSEIDYANVTLADFTNDADYVKWANATSSLWQTSGLLSTASSTIGAGTQAGGLTVYGGATTTGNAYFAGNVGIGVVNPGNPFEVYAGTQFEGIALKNASGQNVTSLLGFESDNDNGLLKLWNNDAAGVQILASGSSYLNGGNVGIGTTTPFAKLSVHAYSGETNLRLFEIASSTATATTTHFVVTNAGNVGIGTTSPQTKLHIYSTSLVDGLTIDGTNAPSITFKQSNTAKGYICLSSANGNCTAGSLAGDMIYRTEGGSIYFTTDVGANNLLTLKGSNGNVGIGTTTPLAKLSVHANNGETNLRLFEIASSTASATTSLFSVANWGGVTINPYTTIPTTTPITALSIVDVNQGITVQRNSSGGAIFAPSNLFIRARANGGDIAAGDYLGKLQFAGLVSGSPSTYGSFAFVANDTSQNGYYSFTDRDQTTARMVVWNTGNVGIGSTTPFAKLSVHANNGETNLRLFEIASSTASATTTHFVVTNAGNVGIGTTSPSNKLGVAGFIDTDQFSGYKQAGNTILVATSTNLFLGVLAGANATVANGSGFLTAIGYQALTTATSSDVETAVGYRALASNISGGAAGASHYNVALGYIALEDNTYGYYNTGIGGQALANNTTGVQNTAVGLNALILNITGDSNVAVGALALDVNATGDANIALGVGAMGIATSSSNHVAIGSSALAAMITGPGNDTEGNVAVGHTAGSALTYGGKNVLLGFGAGNTITTGDQNIVIGYNLDTPSNTDNGQLTIGNIIFGTGVDATAATVDTNALIGIGSSTPWGKLSVTQTGTGGEPAFIVEDSASPDTTPFIIDQTGNVGIGTTSPEHALDIYDTGWTSTGGRSQLHLAASSSPSSAGAYLMAYTQNILYASAGVSWNGTNWINKHATGGIMLIGAGGLNAYTSSGTVGGTATLVNNLAVDATGDTTLGAAGVGTLTLTLSTTGTTNNAVCWDNSGATLLYDCDSTPADYAESYPIDKTMASSSSYGYIMMTSDEEVVTIDGSVVSRLVKAVPGTQHQVIGILSNNYHDFTSAGQEIIAPEDNPIPVALNGRVLVKVNLEGGPIKVGDPITLSSIPGVGTKATTTSQKVGIALETFDGSSASSTVLVFVDNGMHFAYDFIALDELTRFAQGSSTPETESPFISGLLSNLFSRMTGWLADTGNGIADLFATTIHAETVYAKKLCLEDVCITKTELQDLLNRSRNAPVQNGGAANTPDTTPALPDPSETDQSSDKVGNEQSTPVEETDSTGQTNDNSEEEEQPADAESSGKTQEESVQGEETTSAEEPNEQTGESAPESTPTPENATEPDSTPESTAVTDGELGLTI